MGAGKTAPWTVLRLLNWTGEHFAKAGLDSPRLCAEVLLAHALRCQRIELYTRFEYIPRPQELDGFREMVRRAAAREPVAYLVGYKEFYSLRFKVTPDVLVPRPETEILASEAIGRLRGLGRRGLVWDVCTGSGCIAVAIASQSPDATILATDISPAAVAVAQENAGAHKVDSRVRCRVADLLSLPADCADLRDFDAITGNPPYVPDADEVSPEVGHEPVLALRAGPDGLSFLRRVIRAAGPLLRPGGAMILEFGCGQADAVRDLIVATGRFAEPKVLRDHRHIERAVVAQRA
jgi:release factor glutamine methyltransferase